MRYFRSVPGPGHKAGGNGYKLRSHTRICAVPVRPRRPSRSRTPGGAGVHLGAGGSRVSARSAAPVAAFPTGALGPAPSRQRRGRELLPSWSHLELPALPSAGALGPGRSRKIGPLAGPSGEESRASASPTASRDHMETRLHVPRSLLSEGKQTAIHGAVSLARSHRQAGRAAQVQGCPWPGRGAGVCPLFPPPPPESL